MQVGQVLLRLSKPAQQGLTSWRVAWHRQAQAWNMCGNTHKGLPLEPSHEGRLSIFIIFLVLLPPNVLFSYHLFKASSAILMVPWTPSYEIEAPSMCYPTLPILNQWQVPAGMQIPNPNDHNFQKYHGRSRPASPLTIVCVETCKSSDNSMRRDPQILRLTYSCVAHHHHEDHNMKTGWE